MKTAAKLKTIVRCDICNEPFDYRGLGVHRAHAHPGAPSIEGKHLNPRQTTVKTRGPGRPKKTEMLACKDCPELFENPYRLAMHRREEHPSGRRKAVRTSRTTAAEVPAPPKARKSLAAVNGALEAQAHLKYCPRCGLNLVAVQVAMTMTP